MDEEPKLETSPLSQELSSGDQTVRIEIFRLVGEPSWILEVVDEHNNSTVWDDRFEKDSAALAEVQTTISTEGIGSLIGPEDGISSGEWE